MHFLSTCHTPSEAVNHTFVKRSTSKEMRSALKSFILSYEYNTIDLLKTVDLTGLVPIGSCTLGLFFQVPGHMQLKGV